MQENSVFYPLVGDAGDVVIISLVLGLITCFIVYLVSLNRREKRNDYRHWDEKNIVVILLSDFTYDHFVIRKITSFLLFFVMSLVYSGGWMSLIVSIRYGSFNISPLLISILFLLIFRATSEVFIAQVKTAENTSKLANRENDINH